MWLAHPAFGKKSMLFIALLAASAAVFADRMDPVKAAGHFFAIPLLLLMYAAWKGGVWIRRRAFANSSLEVVDYYNPSDSGQNKRIIRDTKTFTVHSAIYLTRRVPWAYLDIVRMALAALPGDPDRSVLILGGGGGSIGVRLVSDALAHSVDLVETSDQMIDAAHRYIMPANERRLAWFRTDARVFVRRSKRQYGCIIVDLFDGTQLPGFVRNASLLIKVRDRITPSGVIICNFGIEPVLLSAHRNALPGIQFYFWHRTCIGVYAKRPQVAQLIRKHLEAVAFIAE